MAKWCFSLGIVCDELLSYKVSVSETDFNSLFQNLKRVEVVEDDESEIIEATRRMSSRYDFVVTR